MPSARMAAIVSGLFYDRNDDTGHLSVVSKEARGEHTAYRLRTPDRPFADLGEMDDRPKDTRPRPNLL